jgi:excisionase family DNA binding protein
MVDRNQGRRGPKSPTRSVSIAAQNQEDAPDHMSEGAISVSEAVAFSGIGRTRLYEFIRAGRLATVLLGRKRLVPKAALKALLREHLDGAA